MERLTVMTGRGAALAMGGPYESEQAVRDDLMARYKVAVARLAAYEDTGLTPEDIQEAVDLLKGAMPHCDLPTELKSWVERCTWHAKKCDELYRELKRYMDAEQAGRLVVLPDWKQGDPPLPGMVIDYDLKGEPGPKGVACYCPQNCPNKDCVGGQCLVGHGTKAKRREEPT